MCKIVDKVVELLQSGDLEMKNLGLAIGEQHLASGDLYILVCKYIQWPFHCDWKDDSAHIINLAEELDLSESIIALWGQRKMVQTPLLQMSSIEGEVNILEENGKFTWQIEQSQSK